MLAQIYKKNIIEKPKFVFFLLISFLLIFAYYSKDFRLDASSETLLIEGDPDLKYLQEISKRYGSKEFLILTYTPKDEMISESSINNLLSFKYIYTYIFISLLSLYSSLFANFYHKQPDIFLSCFKTYIRARSARIFFVQIM